MAIKTIKLIDNGDERYLIKADFSTLGRQYDNGSEQLVVLFPEYELEAEHACTMVVTHDKTNVDRILVANNTPVDITSTLSQYSSVTIGFVFTGDNDYIKGSEKKQFPFLPAQSPEDFTPVDPEIETDLLYVIANSLVSLGLSGNSLQGKNKAEAVTTSVDLTAFKNTNIKFNDQVVEEVDANDFAAGIKMSLDTTNYKLTVNLVDGNDVVLSTQTVDLPSENAIVDASYDETTKKITFVLQSGNTFDVDVSSIVSGLVSDSRTIAGLRLNADISASDLRTALNVDDGADSFNEDNIIAGDNVTITKSGKNVTISSTGGGSGASSFDQLSGSPYDNTNLANALNSKQDTISDLETIRSGASAGATAVQPNANISVLVNDAGFITASVNNLTNYYLKSETYTQAEVNALIGAIKTIKAEIVAELPTADATTYFNDSKTIYMVAITGSGNDYYNEYITVRSGTEGSYTYAWEKIGNTQIDLSGYVQKTTTIASVDLQDNITKSELLTALNVADGANVTSKTGSSAPTTSTVADFVGQFYLDTTNNKTYQCKAITGDGGNPEVFTYSWTQIIRVTDRADQSSFGVVKVWGAYGTQIVGDSIGINPASESRITNRTSTDSRYCPITPANLNFAVKSALTDANHLTMTTIEQATAQSVLNVSPRIIARL